jgi:hypothetical protein
VCKLTCIRKPTKTESRMSTLLPITCLIFCFIPAQRNPMENNHGGYDRAEGMTRGVESRISILSGLIMSAVYQSIDDSFKGFQFQFVQPHLLKRFQRQEGYVQLRNESGPDFQQSVGDALNKWLAL